MDSGYRDALIESLHGLVAHTEKIYIGLAESYPRLLAEMRSCFDRSRNAVACLANNRSDCSGEGNVIQVLAQTRATIEQRSAEYLGLSERDGDLLKGLERGIGALSSIDELIAHIKEESIEMELISLNAMTVALKAGSAGRAFSYITEELKRLSTQTIQLTETITARGSQLVGTFKSFQTSLEEIRDFQVRLFGEFRSNMFGAFDAFSAAIMTVVDELTHLSDSAVRIEPPLRGIMEQIQRHDIIRQSIDHVIISLSELRDIAVDESIETKLNELTFFQSLPDLCTAVLDDVTSQITTSLEHLNRHVDEVNSIINAVERDRTRVLQSVSAGQGDNESISERYEHSARLIRELLSGIARSIQMKEAVTNQSKHIMREVRDLEDQFVLFNTLLTRFHNIDVASRIEVAKQSVLHQMAGTVDEMTALIGRIERDVADSLASTKNFIRATQSVMANYTGVFALERAAVAGFDGAMRADYDLLSEAKEGLEGSMSGFSLFTSGFLTLFTQTTQDLRALQGIVDDIAAIKVRIEHINTLATNEKARVLQRAGMQDWQITNSRLQDIISRFTIFAHKQHAGEVGGFDVGEGVEAGEVTLF